MNQRISIVSNPTTPREVNHKHEQPFHIRPAVESDLPSTHAIYRHYALKTTIAFTLNDRPLEYITKRYHTSISHGLPYLVAVAITDDNSNDTLTPDGRNLSPLSNHAGDPDPDSISDKKQVLGFAHASPFSSDKSGYAPSVEITIFCHLDSVSRGIGTSLMVRLLDDLKTCRNLNWENGHEDQKVEVPVKNVFAIVSQDLERKGENVGKPRGEQIVDWYRLRFGFEVVGRLKGIGWKFDQEIDVLYLQKRLT